MRKLVAISAVGICVLLLSGCGREGVRISNSFSADDLETIVRAVDEWAEALDTQFDVQIVERRANISPYSDAPKKYVKQADWRRGFTVDGERVFLREGVERTVILHEFGHLLGIGHIPGDPLMDGGGGMEPVITQEAISRVKRLP